MMHDRRPQLKGTEAKFRALYQSGEWDTLKEAVDRLCIKWSAEEDIGGTMDEFTMNALIRSGRIQGVKMLIKEIERLATQE